MDLTTRHIVVAIRIRAATFLIVVTTLAAPVFNCALAVTVVCEDTIRLIDAKFWLPIVLRIIVALIGRNWLKLEGG